VHVVLIVFNDATYVKRVKPATHEPALTFDRLSMHRCFRCTAQNCFFTATLSQRAVCGLSWLCQSCLSVTHLAGSIAWTPTHRSTQPCILPGSLNRVYQLRLG